MYVYSKKKSFISGTCLNKKNIHVIHIDVGKNQYSKRVKAKLKNKQVS